MNHPVETITSAQNPRVKLARKLRDKKDREREGLFVVDDVRDLQRALACDYKIAFGFYAPELDTDRPRVLEALPDVALYEVNADLMTKVSYRQNPPAVVAVLHQKPAPGAADLRRIDSALILGLVDLRKPGNIGALTRSADAAGFRAILLVDTALDLYNPNIIRASTGTCFLNNIYAVTSDEALTFLRGSGYQTVAAAVDGDVALADVDFTAKTAVILGTEDVGLNDYWLAACDRRVRIPMAGRVADSLNVSVSGAIFMYEALRQTHH